MDIYLRQVWRDDRLQFEHEIDVEKSISLPDCYSSDIWKPDIFFENGKHEKLHTVTMNNQMFRIFPNGTVVFSQR